MKELFEVIHRGVNISIQDFGREQFRHLGIPVSGVMDRLAYQIGNLLIGNQKNVASIEIAFGGTVLKALNHFGIVLTGGNLVPTVNGEPVEMYKVIRLNKDDILAFRGAKNGIYTYLSVSGGISSQIHFDSQSTYHRAALGLNVSKGAIIYGVDEKEKLARIGLKREFIPTYEKQNDIRFVKSSHFEKIPFRIVNTILNDDLTVGSSDRMGMYLNRTEALETTFDSNILSEGTTFGTIQVLPNGQPIILLADSQTTGGYATLGTVIYSDLWKIVQLKQGTKLTLLPIEVDEARLANKRFEQFINFLEIECKDRERLK